MKNLLYGAFWPWLIAGGNNGVPSMCGYNNSTVYIDSSFLLNVVLPLTLGSTLRGGTYPEIFLFSDTIGIVTIQLIRGNFFNLQQDLAYITKD